MVEHLTEHLDDLKTDAAQTKNQNIGAEQHHRPHFRFRKRVADAASVTANKIELKFAQFVRLDANVGKLSKTGVDTVNDRVARDNIFNDFARGQNAQARGR